MRHQNRVILLVEDNDDDVELARRAFLKSGVASQIVVVRDGREALDYLFGVGSHGLRDPDEQPRMILLDINLPKLSGLEVLRQLRSDARTRLLPVVILSTSSETNDINQSFNLGANSYVRKPVDFGRFEETTHALGNYWLLLNESPG